MTRALLLALVTLAGCSRKETVVLTAVPESRSRLTYQLPADSAALLGVLGKALEETVCLVRSGRADECLEDLQTPSCDRRSVEQVRALFVGVFDSIPRVTMSSPFEMNARLAGLFPGSKPTIAIRDARRTNPCSDWNQLDGTCAALQVREIWVLFRSPNQVRQRPTTLEIFLAGLPCRNDVR